LATHKREDGECVEAKRVSEKLKLKKQDKNPQKPNKVQPEL
jgi:hypothetical protein